MTSFLYLLRNPVTTISPALFTDKDLGLTVIGIENAVTVAVPECAEVILYGKTSTLSQNQRLTQSELLDVIFKEDKIIVL